MPIISIPSGQFSLANVYLGQNDWQLRIQDEFEAKKTINSIKYNEKSLIKQSNK